MSHRCHRGNSSAQAAALPQRPPKPRSLVARMVCASGERQGQGPRLCAGLPEARSTGRCHGPGDCLTGSHLLLAFELLPAAHPSLPLSPKRFFQLWLTQNHPSQEHPKLACLGGPSLCWREGRLRPPAPAPPPQRPLSFEPGGQQPPAGQRRGRREGSRRPAQPKKEKTQHVALSSGRKSTDSFPPSPAFVFLSKAITGLFPLPVPKAHYLLCQGGVGCALNSSHALFC